MNTGDVAEIRGRSNTSVEDAIKRGLAAANKTIQSVQCLWMKEQRVTICAGRPPEYQVQMLITFVSEAWRPATP